MSFHNIAPCILTSYCTDQSLLPFKFKIIALNISLFTFMLHFVVGTIMYGYNTVEHSVTGTNYCKALIQLSLFKQL